MNIADKDHERQITVKQLIEQLQALVAEHPVLADAPVSTDGCDCVGPCSGAELNGADNRLYVVLVRDDHPAGWRKPKTST